MPDPQANWTPDLPPSRLTRFFRRLSCAYHGHYWTIGSAYTTTHPSSASITVVTYWCRRDCGSTQTNFYSATIPPPATPNP